MWGAPLRTWREGEKKKLDKFEEGMGEKLKEECLLRIFASEKEMFIKRGEEGGAGKGRCIQVGRKKTNTRGKIFTL